MKRLVQKKMQAGEFILHVDGDAFFASCEISRRPDLFGKAVVVGEDRGIASALSYEAKKLGVTRGMPIFEVKKNFPSVHILSSHFDLYEKFSERLIEIMQRFLPRVEPYSIDECFAYLPKIKEGGIKPFVKNLKSIIQKSLGITFSFGVAKTKTLAKIASKLEKPDGLTILIDESSVERALKATQIGAVWGIGRKISAKLIGKNIITAYDFISMDESFVKAEFSEPTFETQKELQGKRIFEVSSVHDQRKSIQSTRSLSKATTDSSLLFSELSRNVEIACESLRSESLYTNMGSFFYKEADGLRNRNYESFLLPVYTEDPKVILKAIKPLIKNIEKRGRRYKSTGITLMNLRKEDAVQEDLFGSQRNHLESSKDLSTIDAINRKFGAWSIMHASSLKSVNKRKVEDRAIERKDNYEYGLPLPFMGEVY